MRSKLLFLIVLILSFGALPGMVRAGLNVLENPSFEIGTWTSVDDIPDYWEENEVGGGTANWYKDPAGAYEGDYYVGFSGGTWPYLSTGRTYPCTGGEIWYVGGYVRGTTTFEGNFQTIYADSDIDWINNTFYPPSETEWTYIETAVETPDGATKIGVNIAAFYTVGEIFFDSVWLAREPYSEGAASDPIPPDGGSAANDLEELRWTNPEQSSPSEIITCDVWFSDDYPEYGKYKGDPNFTNYATQIADNQPGNTASLTSVPPLEMEHVYYWRVDVYDPNKMIDEPWKYPIIGKVWTFDTVNQAPEVDAGPKRKAWLTETTVDVQIDATVTDDGMPLEPGTVTLQWTVDDGPATPAFDNDQVEDPIVTFDTVGRYTLRLTADDSLLSASDTVIVDVFQGDYTGLIAHWKLDEESGPTAVDSLGGHDGTLMGDATWIPADGQVSGAIELDGDRDYIEIGDSSGGGTWADLTEEVTVSCWIKADEFTRGWQALVCKGNTSYRMQRNNNNDSIWFGISEAGVAGELSVNDGKWHYVAGTYDGETISLFIDGYLDVSAENSDGIDTNEAALTIGENLEYMAAFDGLIDEARIYEIALPAEKVLAEFVSDGGSESCGQVYDSADTNRDCRVDLLDFAEMAAGWLTCGDITEPSCLE
jgi:hypothetical protein